MHILVRNQPSVDSIWWSSWLRIIYSSFPTVLHYHFCRKSRLLTHLGLFLVLLFWTFSLLAPILQCLNYYSFIIKPIYPFFLFLFFNIISVILHHMEKILHIFIKYNRVCVGGGEMHWYFRSVWRELSLSLPNYYCTYPPIYVGLI